MNNEVNDHELQKENNRATDISGKCLCGAIEFTISANISNLYQCFCTLCQKATGSSSCSSFVIETDEIQWVSGMDKISSFNGNNGFRSDFCSQCGSPVPNKMSIADYIWIPAGLLDQKIDKKIAAQIHLDSQASWNKKSDDITEYADGPSDIEKFMKSLHK